MAQHILRDINLTLHREEIVTLIGPNGSGKSTLVKTLVGAIKPTSGYVAIDENLSIGYVPRASPFRPNATDDGLTLP